ncbi:MAG: 2-(3-amino-3-carboxypropyl)histidine synthase subunit [Nanoarchaeota archaeon]|nr:2-(3-amino-3-carboxypropyl)histidine synthase subunit [Nanoarchaeota archaeon]
MKTQCTPANSKPKPTRVLFIETKKKFKDSDINLELLNNIPGKTIALAATIQYIDLIPRVKSYLESKGKKVFVKQGAYYKGHVLGCNSSALDKSADSILMITDGTFHAINNAIQLQREVYVFTTKTLEKIKQKEIDDYNKKVLTRQKKFLTAKKIGLLVSTKHGQRMKGIAPIRAKIEKQNKKVYVFEANNINTAEFENFPQIQMWVNTACFGLARDDMRIINLSDILEFIL